MKTAVPALGSAMFLLLLLAGCATPSPRPSVAAPLAPELWVDLVTAEEATDTAVLDDLATAGAIFVGETHTIPRHHDVQLWLLQELFARGVPLVLCLEQLEAADQPAIDRFNRREIDLATLARETDWPNKWRNYADYAALCRFAQQHRIPIRGINAPADVIRAVYRGGGVAALAPDQRASLPPELPLDAPDYERLLALQLAVHAAVDDERLRPMIEAQLARDETMAVNIVAARRVTTAGAPPPTAFVILGAGHMRYGLGTPAAVRRRDPAVIERLVLITDSGQLRLSPADAAASREISVSHTDLRTLRRPPADYLRVLPIAATALPPNHPPLPR